jgi:hypothetical protein
MLPSFTQVITDRVLSMSGRRRETDPEDPVEKLVALLCQRLVEILPEDEFQVTVDHRYAIRLQGIGRRHGNVMWLSPVVLRRARLPVDDWLQPFLENAARSLQRFLSDECGRPWPTRTAEPRVAITKQDIAIWWGGPCAADAQVALRPISREEIGL